MSDVDLCGGRGGFADEVLMCLGTEIGGEDEDDGRMLGDFDLDLDLRWRMESVVEARDSKGA